jgi:hypothetical protein
MTFIAIPFVAALLGMSTATAAEAPMLRLVQTNPFVVSGTNFKLLERVTVRMTGVPPVQRTVVARGGEFRIDLGRPKGPKCRALFVVASGSLGSRAVLRFPRPLCLTIPHPGVTTGDVSTR